MLQIFTAHKQNPSNDKVLVRFLEPEQPDVMEAVQTIYLKYRDKGPSRLILMLCSLQLKPGYPHALQDLPFKNRDLSGSPICCNKLVQSYSVFCYEFLKMSSVIKFGIQKFDIVIVINYSNC